MTRQDNDYEPNSMQQNSKVHSLTGRITIDRAHKAFKAVKRNRGAAGVDRAISIDIDRHSTGDVRRYPARTAW